MLIHPTFARWTHKSTVYAVVTCVQEEYAETARVLVVNPSLLFVCEPNGTVKRLCRLSTVTKIVTREGGCTVHFQEGDVPLALRFIEDDRNLQDPRKLPDIIHSLISDAGRSIPKEEDTTQPEPTEKEPTQTEAEHHLSEVLSLAPASATPSDALEEKASDIRQNTAPPPQTPATSEQQSIASHKTPEASKADLPEYPKEIPHRPNYPPKIDALGNVFVSPKRRGGETKKMFARSVSPQHTAPPPDASSEGYMQWLTSHRAEGQRLTDEIQRISQSVSNMDESEVHTTNYTVPSLQLDERGGVLGVLGVPPPMESHRSVSSGGTSIPPPFTEPPHVAKVPQSVDTTQVVYAELVSRLAEQRTTPEDLIGVSEATLYSVLDELGFGANHKALLLTELRRREVKAAPTTVSTAEYSTVNKLLKEFFRGGFVTLEKVAKAVAPGDADAIFSQKKKELECESVFLWCEALESLPGPIGQGFYFPADPLSAEKYQNGTHRLTLTEVALGNGLDVHPATLRNLRKPYSHDALQAMGFDSIRLHLESKTHQETSGLYVVLDEAQVVPRFDVVFSIDLGAQNGPTESRIQNGNRISPAPPIENGVPDTSLLEGKVAQSIAKMGGLTLTVDGMIAKVVEHGGKQMELLDEVVAGLHAEVDRRRSEIGEAINRACEASQMQLHEAKGRVRAAENGLHTGLATLQQAARMQKAADVRAASTVVEAFLSKSNTATQLPEIGPVPSLQNTPLPREVLQLSSSVLVESSDETALTSWEQDFDTNGVIWYIGTKGGGRPFQNPAANGEIGVVACAGVHPRSSSHDAGCLVGRDATFFLTNDDCQRAMITIDLKNRRLCPSAYTLGHGVRGSDSFALRNWMFEASDDGLTWTELARHINDKSLGVASMTKTWPLAPGVGEGYYQHFRVKMTSPCANSTSWSLCLSGIELYGVLRG